MLLLLQIVLQERKVIMKKGIRKAGLSKMQKREAITGYLFASPWLIGLFVFTLYPLLSSLVYSFTNYSMGKDFDFIGWTNFKIMFTSDHGFFQSIWNSVWYTLVSTPLNLICGFGVGLLMNSKVKGIKVFRCIYYLPCVISVVATTMVWSWMFQTKYGLLNQLLAYIGVQGPAWLTDPAWSKTALVIMGLWNCGGGMMMYLAGLKGISSTYYEAAEIDGANAWWKFWKITLPMISPLLFYNLLTGFIGGIQVFTNAFLLTGAGTDNSTNFYVYNMYTMAMNNRRMGYACAMGWILLIVTMSLSLLIWRKVGSRVYYES